MIESLKVFVNYPKFVRLLIVNMKTSSSRILFGLALSFIPVLLHAQETKKMLFIGNSYTEVNNLPLLVTNIATSMGDVLITDKHTPGGTTFLIHSQNQTCINKIKQGDWDFVALQEQSQLPSFPDNDVNQNVFPYAKILSDLVKEHNPCAETLFYMTWGRKTGDAQNCPTWPPVCTYEGMDDLLQQRYTQMANENDAHISPVGKVWRKIRELYPTMELYNADQSHPSLAGSYAAACTFYTVMYRKNPVEITFNTTLSATDADNIKAIVKQIVYDNLPEWNIGDFDPLAAFEVTATGNTYDFENTSTNATEYSWDFGDNTTSTEENPSHTYTQSGTYSVTLTVTKCGKTSTTTSTVTTTLSTKEFSKNNISVYPNPAENYITIENGENNNRKIKLIDMTGKQYHVDILNSKADISALVGGCYMVEIETANTKSYKLVIIQ